MTERTPVSIHIKSEIREGQEAENIEIQTIGEFYEKGSVPYLTYSEEQEYGTIRTIVKVKKNEAVVIRSGAVSMRQRFIENKETLTNYETQFGSMQLSTYTRELKFTLGEGKSGTLNVEYELNIGENQTHLHKLFITFEEVKG